MCLASNHSVNCLKKKKKIDLGEYGCHLTIPSCYDICVWSLTFLSFYEYLPGMKALYKGKRIMENPSGGEWEHV